jgi:maltose alpha-D-glucosyltransferase/alpha-amylase
VIVDFEGEPQRPLEERRRKHSALRDVAGMLRSFSYARQMALRQLVGTAEDRERLVGLARAWGLRVREAFIETYRELAVEGGLYRDAAGFDAARPWLALFELEKALYELRYELDNRPDWIDVPLAGIAAYAGLRD